MREANGKEFGVIVAAVGTLIKFFLEFGKKPLFDGKGGVYTEAVVYKETDDTKVVVLWAPEAKYAGVDRALFEAKLQEPIACHNPPHSPCVLETIQVGVAPPKDGLALCIPVAEANISTYLEEVVEVGREPQVDGGRAAAAFAAQVGSGHVQADGLAAVGGCDDELCPCLWKVTISVYRFAVDGLACDEAAFDPVEFT